ncbi:hypothetical protein [Aquimarina pacifica]|uniref:hypothetical protein n=1 Tax=Aquimarina pacifica TaxID=1296415 RepID=UPI000471212F|nr:hypothetical protein [Aquimarina pacifica]
MKKAFFLLIIFAALFTSCEGERGPAGLDGFDGLDGEDGGVFLAQTFEMDNIDFISSDGFSAAIDFPIPNSIEVFEADVALVYILDPELSADEGVDVWEPLPRTFLFDDGGFAQFRYNFIFDDPSGIFDIQIVLESDDFAALDATFTEDQIFRVVVVPSTFAETTSIDLSNFEAVQESLQLQF